MVIITKIHNKYYNIEGFKHPGGSDAIWHSYGRDATAMFEMYHPFVNQEKLQSILQKYEVSADEAKPYLLAGEDDVPQFEYNTDFSKEIKQEVTTYFKEEADKNKTSLRKITKATTNRWLLIGLLNVLRASSVVWWLSGSMYGLIAFSIIDWISTVNFFHDACHFSLSDNSRINTTFSYLNLNFSSPLEWYYQHNISHHSFTNVKDKDVDMYHGSYVIRSSKYTKYNPIHFIQQFMMPLYMPIGFFISTLNIPIIAIFSNFNSKIVLKYNYKYNKIIDITVLIIFNIIRYFGAYLWFNSIMYSIIPQLIYSGLFILNSQITHLHDDSFHNEKDWYKHQVLTSSNHSIGSTFGYIFSGGLNYQIEHHLFPGVNHCYYPYIQPIVEAVCKKHGVIYKKFNGYYDAFCSYYRHIIALSYDNAKKE